MIMSHFTHSKVYVDDTRVEKNAAFGPKALRLTLRFRPNRSVFRAKTQRLEKAQVFSLYFLTYSTIARAEVYVILRAETSKMKSK